MRNDFVGDIHIPTLIGACIGTVLVVTISPIFIDYLNRDHQIHDNLHQTEVGIRHIKTELGLKDFEAESTERRAWTSLSIVLAQGELYKDDVCKLKNFWRVTDLRSDSYNEKTACQLPDSEVFVFKVSTSEGSVNPHYFEYVPH